MEQLVADGALECLRSIDPVARKGDGFDRYQVVTGRVELHHGSVVEGSTCMGGLQPNYVIDVDHPHLRRFLSWASTLRNANLSFEQKIQEVVAGVCQELHFKEYDSAPYLRLLEEARAANRNLSLGEYLDVNAGVCREHALLTHLALSSAGIDSVYLYGTYWNGVRATAEDHALVIVSQYGEDWVVDSYFPALHGLRLKDLFTFYGSSKHSPKLEFASPSSYGCRFLPHSYPCYWLPTVASL